MLRIACLLLVAFLVGCETVAVKDTASLRTKVPLDPGISTPLAIPVVYYASEEERTQTVVARIGYQNYELPAGNQFQKALDLVVPTYFSQAKPLQLNGRYHYLMSFSAKPTYSHAWGRHSVDLTMKVTDSTGRQVFSGTEQYTAGGGNGYSPTSFFNAYAGALKKVFITFLNSQGAQKISDLSAGSDGVVVGRDELKKIVGEVKPSSTGTGFYVNRAGDAVTASHVVDECVYVEVNHKGVRKPAKVKNSSRILDLAALEVEGTVPAYVSMRKSGTESLGMPVFVTGYPLSGILSDYPSLTVGNVSSLGGLKGAKGTFQFSAPAQPGSSGGPVVDYSGRLVGVVSSSLNQTMMLRKTGTTSQNLNFGVGLNVLEKFLNKSEIDFQVGRKKQNFEKASQKATDYTMQVLCYR